MYSCSITLIGVGLVFYGIWWRQSTKVVRDPKAIIILKNALLTFALATTRMEDMDSSYDYSKFDGSTLPKLSGFSLDNACFSYIVDKDEFKRDPWYTTIMMDKLVAIDRYLSKNLDTNDKVANFFMEFVDTYKRKPDVHQTLNKMEHLK